MKSETNKAEVRFQEQKHEISEKLARLMNGVKEYCKDEYVQYGHVGDLSYIDELITRATDFIFKEGEHA